MFNAIYAREHRDFKGYFGAERSMISYAKFGGGLTTLDTISDAELRERYDVVRKLR